MDISVTIDPADEKRLDDLLYGTPQKLPGEIARAVNNTAKFHVTEIAREFQKILATKISTLKKSVYVSKLAPVRAGQSITGQAYIGKKHSARVVVFKNRRIGLQHFKPNQTKPGVSVKIMKSAGRRVIPGSFGPGIAKLEKAGVWKRVGKERKPLRRLKGPSTWGVYRKQNLAPWSKKKTSERLVYEIDRRIKAILRRQG